MGTVANRKIINGVELKECSICKEFLPLKSFYYTGKVQYTSSSCKQCRYKKIYQWKKNSPKGIIMVKNRSVRYRLKNRKLLRNKSIQRRYGISETVFLELKNNQKNKCAICGINEHQASRYKVFFVDHCHKTNAIRGLLCLHCNQGLGHFKDNMQLLDKAKQYLLNPPAQNIFIPKKEEVLFQTLKAVG